MSSPESGTWLGGRSTLSLLLGMLIASITAFVAWHINASGYWKACQSTLRRQESIYEIEKISSLAREVECDVRGYLISGNHQVLSRSDEACKRELIDTIDRLLSLSVDNPAQQHKAVILLSLSSKEISRLGRVSASSAGSKQLEGPPATEIASGEEVLSEILQLSSEMIDDEKRIMSVQSAVAGGQSRRADLFAIVVIAIYSGCVSLALIAFHRNTRFRKSVEQELEIANSQLHKTISELQLTGSIAQTLQACASLEEACEVIQAAMQRLVPDTTGALAIITESRNAAEVVGHWGGELGMKPVFPPDACIALRTGHSTTSSSKQVGLACRHFTSLPPSSICFPITAHGEVIGILHLSSSDPSFEFPGELETIMIMEHIALGLANLRLRDSLRIQSTRDPLTGLFNRRYMEESLEREVARANRTGDKLSLVMLDLDFFKQFNDSNGHPAGDALLREVGLVLRSLSRLQDIPCRYGGEEIVVLLPGVAAEGARECAERWRKAISQIQIHSSGQPAGSVTASLGIAELGRQMTGDQLLRVADESLYRAKTNGRDRVEMCLTLTRHNLEGDIEALRRQITG